jgi:hypothetical protein
MAEHVLQLALHLLHTLFMDMKPKGHSGRHWSPDSEVVLGHVWQEIGVEHVLHEVPQGRQVPFVE